MTTRSELDEGQAPTVAALLVTHSGARWLPTLLSTLPAALNVAPSVADADVSAQPDLDEESALWAAASVTSHLVVPGRVVLLAVDTGSTDTSVPLVQAAGFTVLSAPSATPFGRAVAMAVAHIAEHHPDVQWLWLLHDDCAADEGALPQMLSIAVNERADVVGPKVHNWSGPRIIVERGIRLSGSGRRFYGVDRGELDQGQYDHIGGEPVLAVGTAGMLVSVAAWSALNGFDPALTTSADDIDFCRRARRAGFTVMLCTTASIRHARAMSTARRRESICEHPGADERYGVMHVLISHGRGWLAWWYLVRLTLGSWMRAAIAVLQRDVRGARDQIEALTRLYTHPSRLQVSRDRVAAAGPPVPSERQLFMPVRDQWRLGVQSAVSLLERMTAVPDTSDSPIFVAEQESDVVSSQAKIVWQRFLHRPLTLLTSSLFLLALMHGWGLLFSSQPVTGGRLADAGTNGWALMQSYSSGWHDIGRGVSTQSPSWMLIVGILSIPFFGHVSGFLAFLLVFFVPLMVLSTALALRLFIRSAWVSATAAVIIAFSPVFTTALQHGDIATLIIALLLPVVIRLALRAVRSASWSATFGVAMCLAAVISLSVTAWLQILALLAGVIVFTGAGIRRDLWVRWLTVCGGSLALVMPWPLAFLSRPWAALLDAGIADSSVASSPWAFLGLSSHGAQWWSVGVFAAALLALARPAVRVRVGAVWGMALVPILMWIAYSHVTLVVTGVRDAVHPSAQSSVVLLAVALGVIVALACDGLLDEIRHSEVGLVHISAAVGVVTVAVSFVMAIGGFLTVSHNEVVRGRTMSVPEFVAIDLSRVQRPRALVLSADDPNPVEFYIASAASAALGDADILRTSMPDDQLAWAAATLVSVGEPYSGARVKAAETLASAGIKYVVLPDAGTGAADIATAVAATPGLRPMTTAGLQQHNWVWKVTGFSGRASYARTGASRTLPLQAFVVGRGPGSMDARGNAETPLLRAGKVYIADVAGHWRAKLDGQLVPVRVTSDGTAAIDVRKNVQTSAQVWRDDVQRRWWMTGQVLAWLVALVMALPARRSTGVADDSQDGDA